MNDEQTLKVRTAPGDAVEIWKWTDTGKLAFDCMIPHERNLGEIMLPPGDYVYYVVSGLGEHRVDG